MSGRKYDMNRNRVEVYYVEDDPDIAENVKTYLESKGIAVSIFHSMKDTKQAMLKKYPSILLIDRNLPDGDGDELCKWIRTHQGIQLPILYLTVRGETADIVKGFQDGADDYVVKPFELEVLYSRICALLRRAGQPKASCLMCDDISLDKEKMAVYCEQHEVVLSQPEYQLLLLLMENKGKTVTRKQLLEQIWDSTGNFVNDNTLTVTMKRLREKLNQPPCLKTIRSFGYRMEDTI